jgi:hypothetical protein
MDRHLVLAAGVVQHGGLGVVGHVEVPSHSVRCPVFLW